MASNYEEDRAVQKFTHKLAALAFVTISDVEASFVTLKTQIPVGMEEYNAYFYANYVNGVPAGGRRRALAPRYAVHLWNQYDSTIEGLAKTNNVLEGWHNRFHMLMEKNHPHLHAFLKEILKEQGDTEIYVVELVLLRKIGNECNKVK